MSTGDLYHKTFYGRNEFRSIVKLASLLLSVTFYWLRQTLAYYAMDLITAVISLMVQALVVLIKGSIK